MVVIELDNKNPARARVAPDVPERWRGGGGRERRESPSTQSARFSVTRTPDIKYRSPVSHRRGPSPRRWLTRALLTSSLSLSLLSRPVPSPPRRAAGLAVQARRLLGARGERRSHGDAGPPRGPAPADPVGAADAGEEPFPSGHPESCRPGDAQI